MNRIDDLIDQSLHSLREAHPSTGLQQRILRTLQEHSAAPQARFRHSIWLFATAAACLTVALLLSRHSEPVLPSTWSTGTPVATSTEAPETRNFPSRSSKRDAGKVRVISSTIDPADPAEQALFDDLHAPSHPAPPMPLTAQERLLLRAMRPGSPIEVAELDQAREPFLRAAEAARERANLQQYASGLLAPLLAFQDTASSLTPENSTVITPPPNATPASPSN